MTMPGPLNTAWTNAQIVNASDLNSWASTVNALEVLCVPLLSVATADIPGDLVQWDANKNLTANNMQVGLTTIPTNGGTTTLTIASSGIILFTGAQNEVCNLPTTGVPAGLDTLIINQSTGTVTVNASNGSPIVVLGGLTTGIASSALFTAQAATPTLPTQWNCQHLGIDIASGKILHVSNTLTFAGTDGTTLTFSPTSSLVDGEQFCTLTAAYTVPTSTTGAQQLFNTSTNGAITLLAGAYFFDCFFSLSAMSATSNSFGFTFGGTANISSAGGAQLWYAEANKAALATAATPQVSVNTAANVALTTATTNTVGWAHVCGKLRVVTGGTLIPEFSLQTAATAIVGVDSYFRIWNVGASTVNTFGVWS
jgi:hypothetical protein